MANLNTELNDIAKTITYLDGYEEIYKEDVAVHINNYANGELTKKEFKKDFGDKKYTKQSYLNLIEELVKY